jgi:hypothetical protein
MKTKVLDDIDPTERVAWRPNQWLKAAGWPFSRPTLYREIHAGRLDARMAGGNTLILTSPRDYLANLPKWNRPPVGRAKRIHAERAAAAEGAAA